MEALGGVQGIADSSLPALAFVIAYTFNGNDLGMAAWIAVGFGAVIAAVRIVRREPLQFALAGFAGVALAAFVADRTGKAEDFFVPGLLLNAGYAIAYTVSIAVGWPLLGVFLGPLGGEGMAWRKDPEKVRAYTRASWIWVGDVQPPAGGPAAPLFRRRAARPGDREDGDGGPPVPDRGVAQLPHPPRSGVRAPRQ